MLLVWGNVEDRDGVDDTAVIEGDFLGVEGFEPVAIMVPSLRTRTSLPWCKFSTTRTFFFALAAVIAASQASPLPTMIKWKFCRAEPSLPSRRGRCSVARNSFLQAPVLAQNSRFDKWVKGMEFQILSGQTRPKEIAIDFHRTSLLGATGHQILFFPRYPSHPTRPTSIIDS